MAARKKPQAAEEQPNEEIPVRFARTLEIVPGERPMEGEDVQALQAALIARKFHCGEEHRAGLYGPATAYAHDSPKGWGGPQQQEESRMLFAISRYLKHRRFCRAALHDYFRYGFEYRGTRYGRPSRWRA